MSAVTEDLRFSIRTLRRSPGFSAVVIATLGVGIAAATLVFSVVQAVFYRIYESYPEPDRLVLLIEGNPRTGATALASARAITEWKATARSFEQVGGMDARRVTIVSGGEPASVLCLGVTEGLLPMLGTRVAAGREFVAADFVAGAAPVVLLGNDIWRQQFGSSVEIVGRTVTVDGRAHAVAGVLGPMFTVLPFFGSEPDLVMPLPPAGAGDRSKRTLLAIARLGPGVTVPKAAAEMKAIAAATAAADSSSRGWEVRVRKARGLDLNGDAAFVVVLTVGVGFVLLIVCANVANLLLCRAASRSQEIATRLAVGAGRVRIARQFLTESLLLAAAGGLAGLCLTYWACRLVSWLVADTNLALLDLSMDARTGAFAVGVSCVSALAAAIVPGVRSSRTPVIEALRERRSLIGGTSPGRLRSLLAAVEIGLAVLLLVCSGLVFQAIVRVRGNDPGFDSRNLASVSVTLTAGRYEGGRAKADYVSDALARLEPHRDIEVAATSFLPAIGAEPPIEGFTIEGRTMTAEVGPSAAVMSVSPTFFRTLRIPLKAGRVFGDTDREGNLPVAVVNERTVGKWFGAQSPVGSRIVLFDEIRTVVGVVADVRNFHLNVDPAPSIYLPYDQRPSQSVGFVLRAGEEPPAAVATARAELLALDSSQVIRGGESYESLIARSLGGFAMTGAVVGVLASVALGLAAVGLYAVVAYSVARRTREIGIRVALGASPGRVAREVLGQGLRLALAGGVPGLLLSLAIGKLLSSRMRGVSAVDPWILCGACAVVLGMVAAGSYIPAHRAARVDPALAARTE
jgi:putative ABC transport system permease protein